jgi:hypothetical protein
MHHYLNNDIIRTIVLHSYNKIDALQKLRACCKYFDNILRYDYYLLCCYKGKILTSNTWLMRNVFLWKNENDRLQNITEYIKKDPSMCIAGGYTTIMLYDKNFDDFPSSDINTYIFGKNGKETLHKFLIYVSENYPNTTYFCKESVINIKIDGIKKIIQLIYTTFISIAHLLNTYDTSYSKCCYYLGNTYIAMDALETFKSSVCYVYSDSYDEDRIYKILKFGLKVYNSNILPSHKLFLLASCPAKSQKIDEYNSMEILETYKSMKNNISDIIESVGLPFNGNDSLYCYDVPFYYDIQKHNGLNPNDKDILLNIYTLDLNSVTVIEKQYDDDTHKYIYCDPNITNYICEIKYTTPLYSDFPTENRCDSQEVALIYNIIGHGHSIAYGWIRSSNVDKMSLIKKKLSHLLNPINKDGTIYHMKIFDDFCHISISNLDDHDIIKNEKYKFIIRLSLNIYLNHIIAAKMVEIKHYIIQKIHIN